MTELPDRVRRRLDEIFGVALPDTTRDEAGECAPNPVDGGSTNEEWLRANRPPHHDRD